MNNSRNHATYEITGSINAFIFKKFILVPKRNEKRTDKRCVVIMKSVIKIKMTNPIKPLKGEGCN